MSVANMIGTLIARRWANLGSKSKYSTIPSHNHPNVLITGSHGQLGQATAKVIRQQFGKQNVIMSDIVKPSKEVLNSGPYIYADILDYKNLQEIIVTRQVDWLIHFSALLSAIGEKDVPLAQPMSDRQPLTTNNSLHAAIKINIEGLHNVMELAKQYKLKIFIPSTIGVFGPETPRCPTPNLTVQRPKTIYGVAKVHSELLGEYYNYKFNLDFRALRFPGVISHDTLPGGGTTDYACDMFYDALSSGRHNCYLKSDTRMPMIYIDDCINSLTSLMAMPEDKLHLRTYNIQALSFTPEELAEEIRNYIPEFVVSYNPDQRQKIADSWPQELDDTLAREHWGWKPRYDLPLMVETMFMKIKGIFNKKELMQALREDSKPQIKQ